MVALHTLHDLLFYHCITLYWQFFAHHCKQFLQLSFICICPHSTQPFEIWGDTVNTAARMDQSSEPGKINISESTLALVKDHVHCQYRGRIDAKNKGELNMYFVEA